MLKHKISWILISLFLAFACTNQEQRRLPYLGNYDISYKKVNGQTLTDTIYQRIPAFTFYNEDSVVVNHQTYAGKVWIS